MLSDRRGFLRGLGLASIPLIGGGVTLIGRPNTPVPLARVAAAPLLNDPHERARYAWEAFSAAMREITVDAHGWTVTGGGRKAFGNLPGEQWMQPRSIQYQIGAHGSPNFVTEAHRDFDIKFA